MLLHLSRSTSYVLLKIVRFQAEPQRVTANDSASRIEGWRKHHNSKREQVIRYKIIWCNKKNHFKLYGFLHGLSRFLWQW